MNTLYFGDDAESSDLGRITERHALTLVRLHEYGFDLLQACRMLVKNLWNKPQEVYAAVFEMHSALVSYYKRHNQHPNAESAVAGVGVGKLMASLTDHATESIMNCVIASINHDVSIRKISDALDLTRDIAAEIAKLVKPHTDATGQITFQDIDRLHQRAYETSRSLFPTAILSIVSSISRGAASKSFPRPDPFAAVHREYWEHGANVVFECMTSDPRGLHRVGSVVVMRITDIVRHHAILHGSYSPL
jgi:hypothetical protein